MQRIISHLYLLLIFFTPLVFFSKTSELFELPKITFVYLITILIVTLWIIRMITEKKIIIKRSLLDIPLILFLLSQLLATLSSIDVLTSIQGYYSRFYGGLLSLTAFSLLYWGAISNLEKKDVNKIANGLIASSVVIFLWAVMEHYGYSPTCLFINGGLKATCWPAEIRLRPFATFGQPNWLAAFLAMVAPLFWYKIHANKKKFKILLYSLYSLLLFTAVLFTKSRSGLLGFSIALIVYVLSSYKITKQPRINLLLITSYALLFILFNPFSIHSPTEPDPTITASTDIRLLLWQGALDIWRDNPLTGTGPETFAYSYYQYRPLVHNLTSEWNFVYNKAHNQYLDYLANTGLLGFGTYLLLTTLVIIQIYKLKLKKYNNSHKIFRTALLAGYISLLVSNFFSFTVVSTGLLFFLFPALAVIRDTKAQRNKDIRTLPSTLTLPVAIIVLYLMYVTSYEFFYADYLYSRNDYRSVVNATTLAPHQPQYWEKLGEILNRADSDKLADEVFQKATTLAPRNIKLHKNIVQQYLYMGRIDVSYYEKAIAIVKEITPLAPTDPMLPYYQGLAYINLGEIEKARSHLSKALLMRPQYREAQEAFFLLEAKN